MDDAFEAWAGTQDLAYEQKGELPDAVPLFGIGGEHVFTHVATGQLGKDIEGTVANYDRVTRDKNGTHHHPYTVALCGVPESIAFAPRLFCIGDGMSRFTKGSKEDSFQPPDEKVELESEALRDRYAIWASSEIGRNWLTQLFSPDFIDWMTNGTPKTFSFQLSEGALCGYVEGQATDPEAMEKVRQATAEVARRIRAECHEELGLLSAGRAAIARSAFDERVEKKIASIKWPQAPPDAATPIKAYRRVARTMVRPYIDGFVAFVVATIVGALWVDTGSWKASVAIGLIPGAVAGIALTRKEIGDRARRFGLESFAREYAKSRGLNSESARAFQARHMDLKIPGAAEQVLSGNLPGDLEGALALCRDRRSRRRGPADHNVLVANGEIVLMETTLREARTAEELDDFCRRGAAKARSETSSGSA